MLSEKEYIRLSLESNLFFLRIAKEHAIFAAASLPPKDAAVRNQFLVFKAHFEHLLDQTIVMSHGIVSPEVLSSGELVTDLTLPAENAVQFLTGIPVNTSVTRNELALVGNPRFMPRVALDMAGRVKALNQEAIRGTRAAIELQTNLLRNVLSCKAFSYTYPLMLDHVTREAQFFVMLLTKLESRDYFDTAQEVIELEITWNSIMDEHPKFIRGYLDPSETQLFDTANNFAKEFDELEAKTRALRQNPGQLAEVTMETQRLVTELRNFKRQGTEGLLACKIKAIMPALLGDHVTREANHYLRLLKTFSQMA